MNRTSAGAAAACANATATSTGTGRVRRTAGGSAASSPSAATAAVGPCPDPLSSGGTVHSAKVPPASARSGGTGHGRVGMRLTLAKPSPRGVTPANDHETGVRAVGSHRGLTRATAGIGERRA